LAVTYLYEVTGIDTELDVLRIRQNISLAIEFRNKKDDVDKRLIGDEVRHNVLGSCVNHKFERHGRPYLRGLVQCTADKVRYRCARTKREGQTYNGNYLGVHPMKLVRAYLRSPRLIKLLDREGRTICTRPSPNSWNHVQQFRLAKILRSLAEERTTGWRTHSVAAAR